MGIISGLAAVVFFTACQLSRITLWILLPAIRPAAPGGEPPLFAEAAHAFSPLLLLVVPTLGGILSGFIVFSLRTEAEGHGTDAAIAAYHYYDGRIRARVPLVKVVASAITWARVARVAEKGRLLR